MKTLEFEIPEGFEVDNFDKKNGKVTFRPVPKDIKERIKTFADVLAHHDIIVKDFEQQCDGLTPDEKAYRQLKLIVSALNEGWQPDWNDSSQYKYYPWFKMASSGFRFDDCFSWVTYSLVGSRLCFKSRQLAEYAARQFEGVYKEFMIVN